MRTHYSHCPNPECRYHTNPPKRKKTWYWRKGFFKTKWNGQPVRRFQCSRCKKTFSSHSFRATKGLHKPYINRMVMDLKLRAVSVSDIARAVGVTKNTVMSRYKLIKKVVPLIHNKKIKDGVYKTNRVQFDELETHELTNLKPVSVALAVTEDQSDPSKSGKIISFSVDRMAVVRKTAKTAREIYGYRPDQREVGRRAVLRTVKKCMTDIRTFTIATDETDQYNNLIHDEIGWVKHKHYQGDVKTRTVNVVDEEDFEIENYHRMPQDKVAPYGYWISKVSKTRIRVRPRDPLFYINQKFAKMRATVARLRRRFWGCTKKLENLEAHLWLFLANNNGYEIDWQII